MLLRRRAPKAGESLLGYLLALAELNEYDSMGWISQMIGWRYSQKFMFSNGIGAEELSALTAVDKELLLPLYYKPAPVAEGERGGLMKSYFNDQRVSRHMIQARRPKVCPMCLKEDGYLRSVWELAPVTSCPLHKTLLLENCPSCNKRIRWTRHKVCVCKCGFDWRDCEGRPLYDAEVEISKHIHWLCGVLPIGAPRFGADPIYSVTLDGFLTALLFIATQPGAPFGQNIPLSECIEITGKGSAPNLSNTDIHVLLNSAFKVFQNWPDRYFEFLKWRREHGKRSAHRKGLGHDFGEFYTTLFNRIPAGCLDFMRDAFTQYVGRPVRRRKAPTPRLTSRDLRRMGYLPERFVRKHLNIDVKFLSTLTREGRLKSIVHRAKRQKYAVIEAASFHRLQVEVGQFLGKAAAASMLHIREKALMSLIQCDVLVPAREAIGNSNSWLFTERSVSDLLSVLGDRVKDNQTTDQVLDFVATFKAASRDGCNFGQFIKAVLSAEIVPCEMKRNRGISGLSFSVEQANAYSQRLCLKRKGAHIYLSDAAKLLGVTPKVAFFLKDKGLLPAQKANSSMRQGFVVSREALDHFKATYVQASAIARRLQVYPSAVASMLMSAGVQPVCGPKVDGRGWYFFRASDIQAGTLLQLVDKAKAKRSAGNQSSLEPTRAAPIESSSPTTGSISAAKCISAKLKGEIVRPLPGDGSDVKTEMKKKSVATVQKKMLLLGIKSEGKSLSGHFSPAEAVDLQETAANRGRSVSEIITRAVALGLPTVKVRFPPITDDYGGRPRQIHRDHKITSPLAKRMKKWKVLKKGKTLTGHFRPEEAIDVLETRQTRKMSTGSILKAAVSIGLPELKKEFRCVQTTAATPYMEACDSAAIASRCDESTAKSIPTVCNSSLSPA